MHAMRCGAYDRLRSLHIPLELLITDTICVSDACISHQQPQPEDMTECDQWCRMRDAVAEAREELKLALLQPP
jgi:hypothetical protein